MRKFILFVLILMFANVTRAQYRDVKLPEAPKQTSYIDYERQNTGFWYAIEVEGGSSVMIHNNMQYVNLALTSGYRFNEFLRIGAGIGCRYYVHNGYIRDTENDFGVPIYANIRGNVMSAYDRDGVPFWSLNVGGITNEGVFASPTIGYSFGSIRNNFQIGLCYTITSFKNYEKTNVAYSYFSLKLGYEF